MCGLGRWCQPLAEKSHHLVQKSRVLDPEIELFGDFVLDHRKIKLTRLGMKDMAKEIKAGPVKWPDGRLCASA
jgi:hypothetical protein